jgi:hypothetical protein
MPKTMKKRNSRIRRGLGLWMSILMMFSLKTRPARYPKGRRTKLDVIKIAIANKAAGI